MKQLILIFVLFGLIIPVGAWNMTMPEVPDSAIDLMPLEETTFADGLLHVLTTSFAALQPDIASCIRTCALLFACGVGLSVMNSFQGAGAKAVGLGSVVLCATILFAPADMMIQSGTETITELNQYGKLLLPVMASALAAQGGTGTSAALYAGTILFDSILSAAISNVLTPMLFIFLVVSVLCAATGGDTLKKGKEWVLWVIQWSIKSLLYLFTGYLMVTGVVSGATDQVALKATKITLSSMVPVVGGILSDASETILVSAGVIKNSVGVWGLLTVIAIAISPFLKIGVQYLLLKATAALCAMFAGKSYTDLISDFATAMGILLAMTGTVCLLILISTVCFMKGMG